MISEASESLHLKTHFACLRAHDKQRTWHKVGQNSDFLLYFFSFFGYCDGFINIERGQFCVY